jgi:multicomponent K+:H+ antiporter subunit E
VRRWLGHPIVSCSVLVVWLGLHSSLAPLHVVSGVFLAVLIPMVLTRPLGDPVTIRRPGIALRLAGIVVWDIIVANLAVALLASIIAITPGTVVSDVDEARTRILVHVLDLDDPARLVAEIKHRYERPLKEIFGC